MSSTGAAWFTAVALGAAGCTYAFTYGGAPADPQAAPLNVHVSALTDLTSEGWPAAVVTDRLRQRLGHPRDGAWVLTGAVTAIHAGNVPVYRSGQGVTAGLAVLRVEGRVNVKRADGTPVLEAQREGSAEMPVGDTVGQTEDMRRLALERACQDLADQLADAVLEGSQPSP